MSRHQLVTVCRSVAAEPKRHHFSIVQRSPVRRGWQEFSHHPGLCSCRYPSTSDRHRWKAKLLRLEDRIRVVKPELVESRLYLHAQSGPPDTFEAMVHMHARHHNMSSKSAHSECPLLLGSHMRGL